MWEDGPPAFEERIFFGGGWFIIFPWIISHGWAVVPSPKILNLPRTYEKLNCKGDPYRFSC